MRAHGGSAAGERRTGNAGRTRPGTPGRGAKKTGAGGPGKGCGFARGCAAWGVATADALNVGEGVRPSACPATWARIFPALPLTAPVVSPFCPCGDGLPAEEAGAGAAQRVAGRLVQHQQHIVQGREAGRQAGGDPPRGDAARAHPFPAGGRGEDRRRHRDARQRAEPGLRLPGPGRGEHAVTAAGHRPGRDVGGGRAGPGGADGPAGGAAR